RTGQRGTGQWRAVQWCTGQRRAVQWRTGWWPAAHADLGGERTGLGTPGVAGRATATPGPGYPTGGGPGAAADPGRAAAPSAVDPASGDARTGVPEPAQHPRPRVQARLHHRDPDRDP